MIRQGVVILSMSKDGINGKYLKYFKYSKDFFTMWIEEQGKLAKQYEFKDFEQAILFINRIAEICEKENHHPEIYNVYASVKLSFCTHDAGNSITEKDHKLTRLIDEIER